MRGEGRRGRDTREGEKEMEWDVKGRVMKGKVKWMLDDGQ